MLFKFNLVQTNNKKQSVKLAQTESVTIISPTLKKSRVCLIKTYNLHPMAGFASAWKGSAGAGGNRRMAAAGGRHWHMAATTAQSHKHYQQS